MEVTVSHRFFLSSILVLVVAFLIGGCGGSTRGTGGLTVAGRVLDNADMPVEGVLVSILETGDSATTLEDGTFSIETELPSEEELQNLNVLFESEQFSAQARLTDVRSDTERVNATVQIDRGRESAEFTEVEQVRRPQSEESSSNGSAGQGSPSGGAESGGETSRPEQGTGGQPPSSRPTPAPTPAERPTPTRTPTATPTRTLTPTATPERPRAENPQGAGEEVRQPAQPISATFVEDVTEITIITIGIEP